MTQEQLTHLATHRVTRNIVFWVAFTALFYPIESGNFYYYPLLFLVFVAAIGTPAYIHNLYVIPKYLQKERFGLYVIMLFALIGIAAGLVYLGMLPISSITIMAMFREMLFCHYVLVSIIAFSLLAFGKFMGDSIQYKVENEALIQQQTEGELQMLKSQINPHFLFNALNTVYGMAMRNEQGTAGTVLMLSNILRHTLYDSAHSKISIAQEITFLKEYVEFMRLRMINKEAIELSIAATQQHHEITPLLLIPFVENAIKHGLGSNPVGSWVRIELETKDGKLDFCCSNNFQPHSQHAGTASGTGIGLKNVKRRLELLYKDRHSLSIIHEEEIYSVHLTIQLT